MASQQHMLTLLANVMVGDWLHITYIPVGRHSACNVKLSDIFKNAKCFLWGCKIIFGIYTYIYAYNMAATQAIKGRERENRHTCLFQINSIYSALLQ